MKLIKPIIGDGVLINESVILGNNILIYDNCSIGKNVNIGNNVIIYPNCQIDDNCILQDNVVLGKRSFSTKATGSSDKVSEKNSKVIIREKSIICTGAIIYWGVELGKNVICADYSVVREGSILDDNVKIGKHSIVEYDAHLQAGSRINAHVLIGEQMKVGRNSFIGPHVSTACDKNIGSMNREGLSPPVIGNDVKVGEGVTIHPGVKIGDNAVIGAGCLLLENIPSNSVVLGHPARIIGKL